jgi:hypothetical protein
VWYTALGAALVVFYGIMTPLWMGIRAAAWVAERGALSLERRPRGKLSSRG